MLKNNLLGLAVLAAATTVLTGCGSSSGAVDCVINLHSESSTNGSAALYTSTKNAAYIAYVDGQRMHESNWIHLCNTVKTVYVSPGPVEIEANALWNNTKHYAALQIDAKEGHTYRVKFDKPSVKFEVEDLGVGVTPPDMLLPR